jgi:hypothetical protein
MSNMEFLYQNYINTSTVFSVTSGTTSVLYMIDREIAPQYSSSGSNSDTNTTSIIVLFNSAKYVDRLILENINWKSFKIYHGDTTTNNFTISNALTTTSIWSNNSETSLYLKFSLTSLTKITIQITATMNSNEEKKCGEIWVAQKYIELADNPSAKNYKPKFSRKEYSYEMSDGGTATYFLSDRYQGKISLDFISSTSEELLYDLYTENTPFIFVPIPTSTTWNDRIWEVNWIGDYTFLEYTDNYLNNGFSGDIDLRETPK